MDETTESPVTKTGRAWLGAAVAAVVIAGGAYLIGGNDSPGETVEVVGVSDEAPEETTSTTEATTTTVEPVDVVEPVEPATPVPGDTPPAAPESSPPAPAQSEPAPMPTQEAPQVETPPRPQPPWQCGTKAGVVNPEYDGLTCEEALSRAFDAYYVELAEWERLYG